MSLDKELANEAKEYGLSELEIHKYSEVRQNFASLLEKTKKEGKVLIRRRYGSVFALTPGNTKPSR